MLYLGSNTGWPKSQETVPFLRVVGKVGVVISMSLVPHIISSSHSEIALSTSLRLKSKNSTPQRLLPAVQVMPSNYLWSQYVRAREERISYF